MMHDPPGAAALLALAREVLEGALAPLLPQDRREDAALVARAMAIAERELRAGDAPFAAAADELAALYGAGDRASLLERLAADIREGACDAAGARRAAVLRLLRAITAAKLRASNPDFLAGTGLG
jgi:Domain of unknown function (DUF6285)